MLLPAPSGSSGCGDTICARNSPKRTYALTAVDSTHTDGTTSRRSVVAAAAVVVVLAGSVRGTHGSF